jgi:P-type conjugative transfer protein TrbJ
LPAIAGSVGGFGGALEVTQIANLAQLADQTARQIQQYTAQIGILTENVQQTLTALQSYQNLVDNTLALPQQVWGNITGELSALQSAVSQGQALAYSLGNIDDIVRQEFGKYDDFISNPLNANQFSQRYAGWSERNNDTIAATLESTGLNIGQFANEEATLQTLRAANSNSGRTQLLQTGNQIGVQQVEQMQKLRQLVAANTQMMGAYYAKASALQDATNARKELYYEPSAVQRGNGQRY